MRYCVLRSPAALILTSTATITAKCHRSYLDDERLWRVGQLLGRIFVTKESGHLQEGCHGCDVRTGMFRTALPGGPRFLRIRREELG
jgi:hypothetical protein